MLVQEGPQTFAVVPLKEAGNTKLALSLNVTRREKFV